MSTPSTNETNKVASDKQPIVSTAVNKGAKETLHAPAAKAKAKATRDAGDISKTVGMRASGSRVPSEEFKGQSWENFKAEWKDAEARVANMTKEERNAAFPENKRIPRQHTPAHEALADLNDELGSI
ncbi:hypothetical protein H9Q69_012981 [Fusarium xylarioides]|nr:hypothetical protein H9Q70_000706 [Fusarium xylarioides]KAG5777623.1 hypothetical protein H9Q73_008705 [Fusarium xylarioides]KAG5787952.1 hypothetical protein H9Q69_012981 [Fusarium xylarioides]KAG5811155.1 hypothetical protein H9Q71_005048 [Fusarium xylarioides]KAG5814800.1 hypothetical protein H9Q74_012043 [Fusarium xylarioides]